MSKILQCPMSNVEDACAGKILYSLARQCGVQAAIEANLRCIDQTGFFETFFRPFLQTD